MESKQVVMGCVALLAAMYPEQQPEKIYQRFKKVA